MTTKKGHQAQLVRPVEIASDGYRAEVEWGDKAGRHLATMTMQPSGAVAELNFRSTGKAGVGSSTLRSFCIEQARALIRTDVEEQHHQARRSSAALLARVPADRPDLAAIGHGQTRWADAVATLVRDFRDRPRPGAGGRDDAHYAGVASLYVDALAYPNPAQVVADRLGYSSKTIQNLLWEARTRRILTKPAPGRAGGELTTYGRSLLDES